MKKILARVQESFTRGTVLVLSNAITPGPQVFKSATLHPLGSCFALVVGEDVTLTELKDCAEQESHAVAARLMVFTLVKP